MPDVKARFVCFALLMACSRVAAHQDPLGEIYPHVVVSDRQFHVYYIDSSKPVSLAAPISYRRMFDARGQTVSKLGTIVARPAPLRPRVSLPEHLTGHTRRVADFDYIVPEWPRKHKGRPFYLVANDKTYVRRELDWPDDQISNVEDFIISDSSFVVLATRLKPAATSGMNGADLWLFDFNTSTGSLVRSQCLGTPAFIYDSPRTSGLVVDSGVVRVVWLEANEETNRLVLHLGSYDLARKSFADRILPHATHWNTSISIGVIGDVLCLAYHGVTPKLSIEFVDLRKN